MKYRCPVCGFNAMPSPPEDHHICSCCGTEFGYDDVRRSYADLQRSWIDRGCPWFSTRLVQPEGWSPIAQLNSLLLRGQAVSNVVEFRLPQQTISQFSFRTIRAKRKRARKWPTSTEGTQGIRLPLVSGIR
jgi:hypothetical protein